MTRVPFKISNVAINYIEKVNGSHLKGNESDGPIQFSLCIYKKNFTNSDNVTGHHMTICYMRSWSIVAQNVYKIGDKEVTIDSATIRALIDHKVIVYAEQSRTPSPHPLITIGPSKYLLAIRLKEGTSLPDA